MIFQFMMLKKVNESIKFQLFPIRRWFILILSVQLVSIVQGTYLPIHSFNQSDLSALESIQDESYVQNRDYLLDHLNQLNNQNYEGRNLYNFKHSINDEREYGLNHTYYLDQQPNVLTRRIALSSLANIFGGNSAEEEKKSDDKPIKTDNQTVDSKASDQHKENITNTVEELNKNFNSNTVNLENQSAFLKNHLQHEKEIETLNRLISFSKNYENWTDNLKNPYNMNHHRQDLINLLHLNHHNLIGSNLTDYSTNSSNDQADQNSKSKNLFLFFSPEYAASKAASKATLFDNSHLAYKPNSMSNSLMSNENDYYPRFNPAETMSDATDQTTEYDEEAHEDENPIKLIENRNESVRNEKRKKLIKNRNRANVQRVRNRLNKVKKNQFDNSQYNRHMMQSGFRPIDNKMWKEQSQISASTGVKRNSMHKVARNRNQANDLSLVETTQQHQNENSATSNGVNSNNGAVTMSGNTSLGKSKRINNQNLTTTPATITSTMDSGSTLEQEFNQLSVSNQPYSFKQANYRFPSSMYGKRLINDILNNQPNIRKNLASSSSSTSNNKVNNNNESVDHSDDENNEKEETLNEQDKQLVTDRTKESSYEKIQEEELNEMPANEFDNKEIDKNSDQLLNQQVHQTTNNQQFNQQIEQSNQADNESIENDTNENDNEQINSPLNSTASSVNQSKESDNLDISTISSGSKMKSTNGELNKSMKQQEKNISLKFKPNKKTNWKQIIDQNYKHYKIFDKYSKLNSATPATSISSTMNSKNQFDFDTNFPSMSSYLSNENFKINLNPSSGTKSSELDDDLSTGNLFPFPNVQYNGKPNSFNNLYYPMMKKKPFFHTYPTSYPGFSTNPLNSMLFDKTINVPIDSYPMEKLPPPLPNPLPPLKAIDKIPLDNKFYNLDSKLHHLNSKYSLNSLTPPPYPPLHLETTKYYEPKGHYDSKYHNSMNHWQSGLAGFLLGVVPFSFLLASMAPTISAISSGTAAAALGRRRRSIDDHVTLQNNRTDNLVCLTELSKIISSLNELSRKKEKKEQAKIYFNQLIDLQNECEFNVSLPIDLYEQMNNILNLHEFRTKNGKVLKRFKNSYYSYNTGNGKMNLLDTILNFLFNFDLSKDRNQVSNQFRTNGNQTNTYLITNEMWSTNAPINFLRQKEGKCFQEMLCKVLLSAPLEKSLFSNFISLVANITPNSLANKYGLDVLVFGLKGHNCTMRSITYC